jgi:hypothetical protein
MADGLRGLISFISFISYPKEDRVRYLEIAKRAIEEIEARDRGAPDTDAQATKETNLTKKVPSIPPGVTLIRWEPKPAPVILTRASVVTDVEQFITATLAQIGTLLKSTKAEPRKLRDLVDALEECGVIVQVPGIGSPSGGK